MSIKLLVQTGIRKGFAAYKVRSFSLFYKARCMANCNLHHSSQNESVLCYNLAYDGVTRH